MYPTRIIACAITQHRHQDTSQSIGKVAQGLAMPLPLGPQGFVHAGTMGITLHRYPRHVGEGMAQASVTAAPPHHLAALPTLPRHRRSPPGVRNTGESRAAKDCAASAKSQAVILRPTPGRDCTMATSEGSDAALASAHGLSHGLTCGSQARSGSANTRRHGSTKPPGAWAASAAPGATGNAGTCQQARTSWALKRRRRGALRRRRTWSSRRSVACRGVGARANTSHSHASSAAEHS